MKVPTPQKKTNYRHRPKNLYNKITKFTNRERNKNIEIILEVTQIKNMWNAKYNAKASWKR
jgi:hypothetical protein